MKILYLITRAEMGGSQTHLVDLLQGYRSSYSLHVAVGEEGYLTETCRAMDIPVTVLPNLVHPASPVNDWKAFGQIRRLIRDVQPDLVHTHTSKAGILGRLAAKKEGVPAVFTAHLWAFATGHSLFWRLAGVPSERIAAACSARIINVSEANRQIAIRHRIMNARGLVTVRNGISDSPLRANPERQPCRIVMVARFAPQKDHALLIDALAGIQDDYKLLLVGDGPTRPAIEEKVRAAGIGHKVEFMGDRRDVEEILASSQLFVLPTHWEGLPISILEAMRAGLPVVASDAGGVAEQVWHGDTGYVTPVGDVEAFREAVVELIRDPRRRAELGAGGRSLFERQFTVAAMLNKTARIYQSVVSEQQGLRPRAVENSI